MIVIKSYLYVCKKKLQYEKIYLLFFLLGSFISNAQIRGTITNNKGIPLSLVTVLEEYTYNGTSSNEQGNYELNIKKTGKYTIVFQSLGFKTQKINVTIDKFPFTQNIQLIEENLSLSEVVINSKENPDETYGLINTNMLEGINFSKNRKFKTGFNTNSKIDVKNIYVYISGKYSTLDRTKKYNIDDIYMYEKSSDITTTALEPIRSKIISIIKSKK